MQKATHFHCQENIRMQIANRTTETGDRIKLSSLIISLKQNKLHKALRFSYRPIAQCFVVTKTHSKVRAIKAQKPSVLHNEIKEL